MKLLMSIVPMQVMSDSGLLNLLSVYSATGIAKKHVIIYMEYFTRILNG